jgi:hypothetical protein
LQINDFAIFNEFFIEENKDNLLRAIVSKWSSKYEVNFLEEYNLESKKVFAFICLNQSSITIEPNIEVHLKEKDVFVVSESMSIQIKEENNFEVKTFYYLDKVLTEEEKNMNTYNVFATLTDKYKLKVRANNKEEAYQKAYSVHIREWEHMLIRPDLKDSVRIIDPECPEAQRWSKWGDFSIEQIERD